jgi:heat shock protein 5
MDWLEEHTAIGTVEDFEEKRDILLSITHPITSRVYAEAGGTSTKDYHEAVHDEL